MQSFKPNHLSVFKIQTIKNAWLRTARKVFGAFEKWAPGVRFKPKWVVFPCFRSGTKENLDPVQINKPGLTHSGMGRTDIWFWTGIMQTNSLEPQAGELGWSRTGMNWSCRYHACTHPSHFNSVRVIRCIWNSNKVSKINWFACLALLVASGPREIFLLLPLPR